MRRANADEDFNKIMKLWRSNNDSNFAGVCGGMAENLGWNSGELRLVWVLATIFTAFAGVLLYLALWYLMPKQPPAAPAFESPPMQPWKS
jgi:phage shock protein C